MKIWRLWLASAMLHLLMTPSTASSKSRHAYNQTASKLTAFKSCEDLEEFISSQQRRKENNSWLGFGVKGGRGSGAGLLEGSMDRSNGVSAAKRPAVKAKKSESKGQQASPNKYTGTNNQVAHIDEGDFVKFDGKYIYQLVGSKFKIIKAWPAKKMSEISSLNLQGQPLEMLMNKNYATIMAQAGDHIDIVIINIQSKSNPQLVAKFELSGSYATSRLNGDKLYLISKDHYSQIGYHRNQEPYKIKPTYRTVRGNRDTIDVVGSCQHIYVPEKIGYSTFTRIATLDLKNESYSETLAAIPTNAVYVSDNAIYTTQANNVMVDQRGSKGYGTMIHQFSTPKKGRAKYAASGKVMGHLINQFAMDEHDKHLRVATTGHVTHNFGWGTTPRSGLVNLITTLKRSGDELEFVGKTRDLAKGERIKSIRFDGEKGYLVTFRQVDPLFTLDLSDPEEPRAVGELKIPGFSTYIHVLKGGRLLTVGHDADQRGRARGVKLSIFDVSNFAKPREIKSLIFNRYAKSDATFDHRAFSYYADKGILAIPMTGQFPAGKDSSWTFTSTSPNYRSALLLFKISKSNIVSAGEVDMSDLGSHRGWNQWQSQASVRRAFFADDVVFAVGNGGIRAARISRPEKPLRTVKHQNLLASQ